MRVVLESNVQVDGLDTYVGGNDLATILRAAFYGDARQSAPRIDLGRLRITVEHVEAEANG